MECPVCDTECGEGTVGVNVGHDWLLYRLEDIPDMDMVPVTCGSQVCYEKIRE
jgi:hypothetical protein